MKTWFLRYWDSVRDSLWFVPVTGVLSAFVLALITLKVDGELQESAFPFQDWVLTTGPAARSLLSSIAGALVTVTGVVFSITMMTLAQTSSQFGSRLLRSFLNHNITQTTLAIFLSTSLFCFMVLRAIREVDGQDVFVPHLSVFIGLLLGLVSVGMFIYFIHHVSQHIQAQSVVNNLAVELDQTIERLFPDERGESTNGDTQTHEQVAQSFAGILIDSRKHGYLQAIDYQTLIQIAKEFEQQFSIHCRPGEFLAPGQPLAQISTYYMEDEDSLAQRINECFLTGMRRTPRQDVECVIFEMVEVAVRALSPGINDPHTAMACVDHLGVALGKMAQRRMPHRFHTDADGELRLITERVRFVDVLNSAFDEIRQNSMDCVVVRLRILQALQAIVRNVRNSEDVEAVLRQATMVVRAGENCAMDAYDEADIREQQRVLTELIDQQTAVAARMQESEQEEPEDNV